MDDVAANRHAATVGDSPEGERLRVRTQTRPAGISEPPGFTGHGVNKLADEVITILERRLKTERERRGILA